MSDMPFGDLRVEEALGRYFNIEDQYIYYDQTRYIVSLKNHMTTPEQVKEGFHSFIGEIRQYNYLAKLSIEDVGYLIIPFKMPREESQSYRTNIILFAATFITVFFDGYMRSETRLLTEALMPGVSPYLNAFLFTISLLGIFGIHELGHKYATIKKGISASMPYFIPAPPGMGGTFGAVITQKEPPVNRDDLFDMGFSGPFVGFIITIIVTIIGLKLSFIVSPSEILQWSYLFPDVQLQALQIPRLIEFIWAIIGPNMGANQLILHPVAFAAWVGCLITFLNLIPVWQLDGGHIIRAVFGKKYHKPISYVGLLLMMASGFTVMAVLIGFFTLRANFKADTLLDEISPLSKSRKALMVIYLLMLFLTVPL